MPGCPALPSVPEAPYLPAPLSRIQDRTPGSVKLPRARAAACVGQLEVLLQFGGVSGLSGGWCPPPPFLGEEQPGESFSFEGILGLRRAQLPTFCTSPGLTWSSGGLGAPEGGQCSLPFLAPPGLPPLPGGSAECLPWPARRELCRLGGWGSMGEGQSPTPHVLPQWMLFQLLFSIKHLLVLVWFASAKANPRGLRAPLLSPCGDSSWLRAGRMQERGGLVRAWVSRFGFGCSLCQAARKW